MPVSNNRCQNLHPLTYLEHKTYWPPELTSIGKSLGCWWSPREWGSVPNKRYFSCHSVSTAVTVTCPKTKREARLQCPKRELKHSWNPVQSWRDASQCTTSRFFVSWREVQRDCQHTCCNISLHKASPCIPLFKGGSTKVIVFHSWSIQTKGPIMKAIWLCNCYRCLESKSPTPAYITWCAMGRHNGLIIHMTFQQEKKRDDLRWYKH